MYALLYMSGCMILILCFFGCSVINPPPDYYQEVVEIEDYGEQARQDGEESTEEIIKPESDLKPVEIAKSPVQDLGQEEQEYLEEELPVETQEEVLQEPEKPPIREVIQEPTSSQETSQSQASASVLLPSLEPIAVASDVIKSALRSPDLRINTRNVELVNGRLSGGKNSVRVNFLFDSLDGVGDKFVAICAVIYHLDREANTIDVVVGIAEDNQANLRAILQSDMSDITDWMNNRISPTEWYSRVTKKIL